MKQQKIYNPLYIIIASSIFFNSYLFSFLFLLFSPGHAYFLF